MSRLSDRLDLKGAFSLVLVSDAAMQRINRQFARKDYATDVLSFPTSKQDREIEPYLGDIFISVETADRQKRGRIDEEICILTVHGVLHLLGFDHEMDDGEMEEFETRLNRELGLRS
jgi:probable rRNA maturation factor